MQTRIELLNSVPYLNQKHLPRTYVTGDSTAGGRESQAMNATDIWRRTDGAEILPLVSRSSVDMPHYAQGGNGRVISSKGEEFKCGWIRIGLWRKGILYVDGWIKTETNG